MWESKLTEQASAIFDLQPEFYIVLEGKESNRLIFR